MQLLCGVGLVLAWRLPPAHPFIVWASAVREAAFSAWVVLALISPDPWPIIAPLTGAAMALDVFLLCGRRLLPGLAPALAALWAVDAAPRSRCCSERAAFPALHPEPPVSHRA